jgi:hypothetical protein
VAEKILDGGDGFFPELTHVGVTEESCWEHCEGSSTGLAMLRWVAGGPDKALQPPARVKDEVTKNRKVSPKTPIFHFEEHKPKLL